MFFVPSHAFASQEVSHTDMAEAKVLFTQLWLSYLGMWGPPFEHRGRKDHHWRLHRILDFMEEVQGDHDKEIEWNRFLESLPGFVEYWSSPDSQDIHHAE